MFDEFFVKSKFREYGVAFIEDCSQQIRTLIEKKTLFVIDSNIYKIYFNNLIQQIPKDRVFVVEATEKNKTLENCQVLINQLLDKNIRKNTVLVAIGGGIIQDITAFVSSIIFRGIEWVFIPTTLLAQADSCVGSKTSINFQGYKNLLGNFYPPSEIWIDTQFLETLSDSDIKSGIGEMLHFYFINGNNNAYKLFEEYENILGQRNMLKTYIESSLMIKKDVVERDEFDKSERNLFNYGHTFGHAIEAITDYEVAHGQAVTLGMDIANYISLQREMLSESDFNKMHKVLTKNMPSFKMTKKDLSQYFNALSKDKKNINDDLTCILTKGPGQMQKLCVPIDDHLKQIILAYFDSP